MTEQITTRLETLERPDSTCPRGTWFFVAIDLATNGAVDPWWEMSDTGPTAGQNYAIPVLSLFRNVWGKHRIDNNGYPLEGQIRIHGFDLDSANIASDQLDRILNWFKLVIDSLLKYQRIEERYHTYRTPQLVVDATYERKELATDHFEDKERKEWLLLGEAKLNEEQYAKVLREISQLSIKVDAVHQPIRSDYQDLLNSLKGKAFGSLESNQVVAHAVQELTERLQARIMCPRDGCGVPAVLECRPAGATKNGSFLFRHRIDGRHVNHFSATKLPTLQLVDAPPRLKRKRTKKVVKKRERSSQ